MKLASLMVVGVSLAFAAGMFVEFDGGRTAQLDWEPRSINLEAITIGSERGIVISWAEDPFYMGQFAVGYELDSGLKVLRIYRLKPKPGGDYFMDNCSGGCVFLQANQIPSGKLSIRFYVKGKWVEKLSYLGK